MSREGRRKFCNLILFVFSVLRQLYRMDGVFECRVKPLNSNEVAVSRNDFIVYLLYPIFSAFHSWWTRYTRTIFIERPLPCQMYYVDLAKRWISSWEFDDVFDFENEWISVDVVFYIEIIRVQFFFIEHWLSVNFKCDICRKIKFSKLFYY